MLDRRNVLFIYFIHSSQYLQITLCLTDDGFKRLGTCWGEPHGIPAWLGVPANPRMSSFTVSMPLSPGPDRNPARPGPLAPSYSRSCLPQNLVRAHNLHQRRLSGAESSHHTSPVPHTPVMFSGLFARNGLCFPKVLDAKI